MRHESLYIRPFEPGDVDRVAALLDGRLAFDAVTSGWVREKTFEDPDYDGDITLCAIDGGKLVGFCQGIVRELDGASRGWVKWFATAADAERRGVATRLFDLVEEAIRRRRVEAVRVADSPPNYTWPGLDPRYTAAYVFLARRGYRRTGEAFNMDCDLTASTWDTADAERRLTDEGVAVRRAERSDLERTLAHLRGQFPHWAREVASCFLRNPISLHVALDGERVVGFSAYDANNLGMAWFGPMGTDPAYRKKGIGKVLLHRCLADQKAQGYQRAIIPWVGPLEFYYRHCGAVVSRLFWKMEKTL